MPYDLSDEQIKHAFEGYFEKTDGVMEVLRLAPQLKGTVEKVAA